MEGITPPPPNVSSLPAADVGPPPNGPSDQLVVHQAFPVRQPEAELTDFVIPVRATVLERCRQRLARISNNCFPWHEVALGISTLTLGVYFGWLMTTTDTPSAKPVVPPTLMLVIGVGSGVAYAFLRNRAATEASGEAKEVLAELPDPERTR